MPYGGKGMVDAELDFLARRLVLRTSEGGRREVPLGPRRAGAGGRRRPAGLGRPFGMS
jgi:hypothetical protein